MSFWKEITKPFKKVGKELGKAGKGIGFDKWGPWVMMAAPFMWPTAYAGIMSKIPYMNSTFMNSAFGAAAKDATIKYATAVAMDKEHPEEVFKSSFLTNMALGYYKTGGDMDAFFGKAPKPISPVMKDVNLTIPGKTATTFPPKYAYSGQVMPHVSYEMTAPSHEDILSNLQPKDYWTGRYDVKNLDKLRPAMTYETSPTEFTKNVWDPINQREIMAQPTEAPLAGMGLQKQIKEKPGLLDAYKGMPAGMTVGSPAYDELYGIGKQQWDPKYGALTAWQLSQGGPNKEDIEKERLRLLAQFREDLMWRPDAPDYFDDFFLGDRASSARGGIASLANGGRIGYQGGGPAGMSLEELKRQIFSKYMATNYGDDQMAMAPDTLDTLDYTDPDLYRGTGEGGGDDPIIDIPLGGGPSFEEEFGGYLDLASGPQNQGIHDAYEDYLMNGGTLSFEEWKLDIDEVMNAEDWAAARGGRMGYYGGGELNAIPGGAISGPGTGTSDSIPAKLSNNEFVFTENAVKAAGGGDVNAGAQQLYGIMNALDPNSARINEPPVYS